MNRLTCSPNADTVRHVNTAVITSVCFCNDVETLCETRESRNVLFGQISESRLLLSHKQAAYKCRQHFLNELGFVYRRLKAGRSRELHLLSNLNSFALVC